MARKTMGEVLSGAVKSTSGKFDLKQFKEANKLNDNTEYKPDEFIPVSEALSEALSIKGFPQGRIIIIRGHSDTGKSTALMEAAIGCQKLGILPVFINTEMKWSWDHVVKMGLEVEESIDEDGVVKYDGNFIYMDRNMVETIEDVAERINGLLLQQKTGKLPYSLCFLWDAIGNLPCKMSMDSGKNNNEWNAGAMSQQFFLHINPEIGKSRAKQRPYTNTLIAVNHIWLDKPTFSGGQPSMKNSGGDKMWKDAALQLTFGGVKTAGTMKITAERGGKEILFAKRTKVAVEKNHFTDVTTSGTVIMTPHGFIRDDKKSLDAYKKEYSDYWLQLGIDDTTELKISTKED